VQEGGWEMCLLESRNILLYQVPSAGYAIIPQLKCKTLPVLYNLKHPVRYSRGKNLRAKNLSGISGMT